jgi:hypothetical protein
MIKTRFTKSAMENEEGMNHLWIQVTPIGHVENVRIQITLPAGIHRLNNLSSYHETDFQEIEIPNPLIENNVVVEMFTRDPVMSGEKTIIVAVIYKERDNKHTRVEHYVPLSVVSEEEIDSLIIDEEAVDFIKELLKQQHRDNHQEFIDYSQPKIIRIESNKYSDLEKKYRIEGDTDRDHFMSSQEALNYGLIDAVLDNLS